MNTYGYLINCNYTFDNKDIIIPAILDGDTVRGIIEGTESTGIFYNKAISSLSMPPNLEYIGAYSFSSNLLTDVSIPNTVTYIGEGAFSSNEFSGFVLPALTTPGFVDWIDGHGNHHEGGATVTDLSIIYRANLPYTLTDEDVEVDVNGSILSCSYGFEASMITIPETLDGYTVKGIGDDHMNLFYEKMITSLQLPSGLEQIGANAFSHNLLTSVTIPEKVNSIGDDAFSHNLMTSVVIPASVHYIGAGAFAFNQIAGIVLPEAQKEGYTFDDWNGNILANTEVKDLSLAYTANFTLITGITGAQGFSVSVYPNPTKGYLSITGDAIHSIELVSLSGVLLKKWHVTGTPVTLDVTSFERGIYLLRIEGNHGSCVRPVVIEL
jgi:hypothetical protein